VSTIVAVRSENPFIGLHYFDEQHEELFFGRDEQVRDLLARVEGRFVTVIGSSGTGKSSLVRAGLIPALRAGFMLPSGSNWRILTTRPGSSPIRNLAETMERTFPGSSGVEVTLRRGPMGLVEAARQCGLEDKANLLVVVDQFEEIFRFQREAKDADASAKDTAAEEAAAFVKLLLEASARCLPNIYVLITMRSDYLGMCAQFRDLPERINTGLYLIPRMRRDQLEDAITGPAAIMGVRFSPPLVQKLLNDAGEDPDQLPVLQHALLRAWLKWKAEGDPSLEIDFRHYGGIQMGLNQHAEELFLALPPVDQKTAEIIFRCLTERDPSNTDIRRPTLVSEIADVAGISADQLERVADSFRGEGVSFLTPAAPVPLKPNTMLDITHESLIRKWQRLGGRTDRKSWVLDEAEALDQYHDLVKRGRRALPRQAVLTGVDLDDALAWRDRKLTPAWARRYEPAADAFPIVSNYIDRSDHSDQIRRAEEELERRWRKIAGILTMLFLLAFVVYLPVIFTVVDQAATNPKDPRDWARVLVFGLICALYIGLYFLVAAVGKGILRRLVFNRLVAAAAELRKQSMSPKAVDARALTAMAAGAYATFLRRLSALLIDIVMYFVFFIFGGLMSELALAMGWAHRENNSDGGWIVLCWISFLYIYETVMICLPWRATLGQKAVGIAVVDSQGRRLGFIRANARFFASLLSLYTVIGPFMTLWTKRKQALHDKIARTYMIRVAKPGAPLPGLAFSATPADLVPRVDPTLN
jgi:uncharacterized RDD family membrane protein YckC